MRRRFEPALARFGPARERALDLAEERPIVVLAFVFALSFGWGFLLNALGSVVLEWRQDPLVTGYRDTLSFSSALVGDGVLLPFTNLIVVDQLLRWRRTPRLAEVFGPILFGAAVTLAAHAYQAANALVNWTMPHAYSWTTLGYTHALFMWVEISLLAFFWSQAGLIARLDPRAALHPRLAFVLLCMAVFLRLLLADYGYWP